MSQSHPRPDFSPVDHAELALLLEVAGPLTRERVEALVESTTVDDARGFFAAFDHVDVAVPDPPEGLEPLDVRRGAAAGTAAAERGLTLGDVLERSVPHDGNAAELVRGLPRAFRVATRMAGDDGPATDRVARAFLRPLGDRPDTLVRTEHGDDVAREVRDRAAACADLDDAGVLAADLRERGVNPGTTADLTAAATFVALERGLRV